MPKLISLLLPLLCILMPCSTLNASSRDGNRVLAFGSTHSLKGIGLCADFDHQDAAFSSVAITADMIDILDGKASTPGLKFTYHCNLLIADIPEKKLQVYAGPGLTAGHVRNIDNYFGFMAGVSGDIGVRMFCLKSVSLGLEFQADFSLIFKNKNQPYMSLYSAGFRQSYFPHLRLQYCF